MKTISKIKKERETKMSSILAENKVFFAFSNEQFKENKTPLKEGEKYRRLIGGGFIPQGNYTQFNIDMDDLEKWYKKEVKQCRNEHILYELNNYESFYTNDISDAWEVLKCYYTYKQVAAVFNDYKKKAEYKEQF